MHEERRDYLGRCVRLAWVEYCKETGDTKPSHIAPWDELSEWDKEADRRIAEAVELVVRGQISLMIENLADFGDDSITSPYDVRMDIVNRLRRL